MNEEELLRYGSWEDLNANKDKLDKDTQALVGIFSKALQGDTAYTYLLGEILEGRATYENYKEVLQEIKDRI